MRAQTLGNLRYWLSDERHGLWLPTNQRTERFHKAGHCWGPGTREQGHESPASRVTKQNGALLKWERWAFHFLWGPGAHVQQGKGVPSASTALGAGPGTSGSTPVNPHAPTREGQSTSNATSWQARQRTETSLGSKGRAAMLARTLSLRRGRHRRLCERLNWNPSSGIHLQLTLSLVKSYLNRS